MVYLWIGTIYRRNGVVLGEKGLEAVKTNKPRVSRADYRDSLLGVSRDRPLNLQWDGRAFPEICCFPPMPIACIINTWVYWLACSKMQ